MPITLQNRRVISKILPIMIGKILLIMIGRFLPVTPLDCEVVEVRFFGTTALADEVAAVDKSGERGADGPHRYAEIDC